MAKKKNTHKNWRLARKKVNCGTLKKRRKFGNKAKDSGEGAVTADVMWGIPFSFKCGNEEWRCSRHCWSLASLAWRVDSSQRQLVIWTRLQVNLLRLTQIDSNWLIPGIWIWSFSIMWTHCAAISELGPVASLEFLRDVRPENLVHFWRFRWLQGKFENVATFSLPHAQLPW